MIGAARRPMPAAADSADGAMLRDLIVRCRRQARLVLFVRWGATACAGLLMAAAVAFLSSRPLPWPWVVVAGGVVVAVCAVAALWRTPTPARVAAEIDRRLRLDDSVAAALQVHGSSALVESLVVRHAIGLTRGVDAGIVFPLDAGRPALALGIAASLLLVTTLAGRSTPARTGSAAGQVMSGDAAAGSPTADTARQQTASTTQAAARGGAAAMSGRTGRGDVPQNAPSPSADSRPSPASSADEMSRGPGDATTAGNTSSGQSVALPSEEPRSSRRSVGSGGGAVRDDPSGQRASGRGTPGTGGQGASDVGRGSGSGGVRGGTLNKAGAVAETNETDRARYGTRYSAAGRGGAAAAMTHDDVPPDLRSYVRDYFAAIAPSAEGK